MPTWRLNWKEKTQKQASSRQVTMRGKNLTTYFDTMIRPPGRSPLIFRKTMNQRRQWLTKTETRPDTPLKGADSSPADRAVCEVIWPSSAREGHTTHGEVTHTPDRRIKGKGMCMWTTLLNSAHPVWAGGVTGPSYSAFYFLQNHS